MQANSRFTLYKNIRDITHFQPQRLTLNYTEANIGYIYTPVNFSVSYVTQQLKITLISDETNIVIWKFAFRKTKSFNLSKLLDDLRPF